MPGIKHNRVLKVAQSFLNRFAYDYSSVQAQIPDKMASKIRSWGRKNIPFESLISKGLETDIHVTVKYGIHITDFTALRNLFVGVKPLGVVLGCISLFKGEDQDVVKIEVNSPDLHKINSLIASQFKVTDTFKEYKPHVTVGYVKKGLGKPYDGCKVFAGSKLKLDEITFSGKNNRETLFKLI